MTSVVYIIGDPAAADGPVKIGTTTDLRVRLGQIKAGTGCVLPRNINASALDVLFSYPGDRQLERGLHRYYADYRLAGEWFALSPSNARGLIGNYINEQECASVVWKRAVARGANCTCYDCHFMWGPAFPVTEREEWAEMGNVGSSLMLAVNAMTRARLGVGSWDSHVTLPASHCDIDRAVRLIRAIGIGEPS